MWRILYILWQLVLFLIIISLSLEVLSNETSRLVFWGIILLYNQNKLVGLTIYEKSLENEKNILNIKNFFIEQLDLNKNESEIIKKEEKVDLIKTILSGLNNNEEFEKIQRKEEENLKNSIIPSIYIISSFIAIIVTILNK